MASRFPARGGVIVTGAAQGIGRRLALMLSAEGVDVCIADSNEAGGRAVVAEGAGARGRLIFAPADVSDEASCADVVAAANTAFGGVFGLVNNASIFSTLQMRPFWEIPPHEWDRVQNVNLKGVFNMSRAALASLREAEGASIVNIASSTLLFGRPNYAHYVSSKAGVMGLSRAMARELGSYNIRVNTLTPGPTFTEIERKTVTPEQREAMIRQQCLARAGAPDDIAAPIAFLLSAEARWITGQLLNVDGGMITH
ncbi:3-oxoacyl-ACP reductase [Mesorhizobium sp. L-8-10]|uniref:SDR family NAD(P)-dependent oxidoreductase n=1 Tax=Mesorhizobium sp. L-8-10 TaxID=2744523 RepID=UPI001928BBEB|nr:SDR family oxidoreductase [Mesorhizobium sp. L-8-10]BCH29382.1 3-oxoacyl-ACP reductase [Mesorhizobium sp. L-8-10]